ncbi:PD-(D/E)XK nuclease family protein [Thiohalophilus sp.]|uniref:PD-(D/E)XK nuclease family protein n=1 Tax=Thiohalophilus sp. TaxID=3028392 RepID=UPI002ACD8173|nr:PD-(D/E)XK nuclease family protein [Thiohalophilus sp.]MDZ7802579.1 PD-(D/E)XK nuclease family protein [Thiohalophilus sp.]
MTPDSAHHGVVVLPYHADPLQQLARDLIQAHREQLPDLTGITLLVDDPQVSVPLRRQLLDAATEQGVDGLVGLAIQPLRDWVRSFVPDGIRVCSAVSAELLLVDALRPYQHLFNQANPWLLASELLELFQALTLNEIDLPADREHFIDQLQAAYGARNRLRQSLSREATIVHTLWHAWHEQIRAQGLIDADSAHLLALRRSLEQCPSDQPLWFACARPLAPAEQQWLQVLQQRGQLQLYLHGRLDGEPPGYPEQHLRPLANALGLDGVTAPASTRSPLLETVFGTEEHPLQETARALAAEQADSPLHGQLGVLLADNAEQEARAIDIRVREWLLAGKTDIAIVTENRRLARRVRALLERAGIQLADAAGWALSTTSAAAALERWLECLEEDFAHLPLLDLLKSPFVFADRDRDTHRLATWRLEQDVIRHENVARNLNRYRAHAHDRRKRLAQQTDITPLLDLLDRLEAAAAPLLALRRGHHPADDWIAALQQSLALLEMDRALQQDAAGSRLLELLTRLAGGIAGGQFLLGWSDFRTWLGRHLERTHFRPRPTQQRVRLLGLAQSQLQQFEALILAGAEQDSLPGHPPVSPFFNDQVRHELGLQSGEAHYAERFYHLRRLLEAAPAILITARAGQDGEPVVISHWLEHLLTLHREAWPDQPLEEKALAELTAHAEQLQIETEPQVPLPAPSCRPQPGLDPALLPTGFSPSDYQQLLDCPYQYYAARALQLKPPEEIREALSKADYGERVHLCLQALHSKVRNLPGPFTAPFDAAHREEAVALLETISREVFADVLADNFEHQGWLSQWRAFIPAYVDWQIRRRAGHWQVSDTEQRHEVPLGELSIRGRLDRIDRGPAGTAIIDYKTGAIPKAEEVEAGEAIQLPFYALLQQQHQPESPVSQVAYLRFDKPEQALKLSCPLEEDALHALSEAIGRRLQTLVGQINTGQGLPAWGDEKSCNYCEMGLLCRKAVWQV